MRICRLTQDDGEPWAELLSVSFGRQVTQMVKLWQWLHAGHEMLVCGIWDGARLVAQYTSLVTALRLPGGASAKVGLSVNMAVHPDYRGRGLVKQAAAPVYQALSDLGGVAGVGFSNAAGVKVDRHSKSYGYRVVGQLVPRWLWLSGRLTAAPLRLTDSWPDAPWNCALPNDEYIRFDMTPAAIRHRFAEHPFRRYRFGVWERDGQILGLVVDRPIAWGRVPGAALLAAYADDLTGVLAGWATVMRRAGIRFVHVLTTPVSPTSAALKQCGLCLALPYSRSPYYLTIKPLQESLQMLLSDFSRWDCVGGDIL